MRLSAIVAGVAGFAMCLSPTATLAAKASDANASVVAATPTMTGRPAISVKGNKLIAADGKQVRLLGVNRSGTEYACSQGWGIFDGPNTAASVKAMTTWDINAVRVPVNETCWLGDAGSSQYQGAVYRKAIEAYVKLLRAHGLFVIVDLHFLGESLYGGENEWPMADEEYTPKFWASAADAFKSDSGVIFDLYNEPHDITWSCWLNGCKSQAGWQIAGMQQLVNVVRKAGADNPLMLGGLGYSSDLSGWVSHQPKDPKHQLIASFHNYNFSACNTEQCWQRTIEPVNKVVPVVTGENGENDCAQEYVDKYMTWADRHDISYLGWTWDADGGWTCEGGPALITNYNGTPTDYGKGLKSHLAALRAAGKLQP